MSSTYLCTYFTFYLFTVPQWDDFNSDLAILVDGTNCTVSTTLYLQSKNNHSEQNSTRPPVFRARLQPGVLCVTMIQLQQ